MVKFLLSLMLLASSWAWGAERLDGVAETKGGLDAPSVITELTLDDYNRIKDLRDKIAFIKGDKVWLLPIDQAMTKSGLIETLNARAVVDDALDKSNWIGWIELFEPYSDQVVFAVLRYLAGEPFDWHTLSATELVGALDLQLFLQIELDMKNSKLYNVIANQLLQLVKNNDPKALMLLQRKFALDGKKISKFGRLEFLNNLPGTRLRLSQTIQGGYIGFSPDGSKLYVREIDETRSGIQLYQIDAEGLTPIGVLINSLHAGWGPDGNTLWMEVKSDTYSKVIQLYQVANGELVTVGAAVPGWKARFSSDGSKLLVHFTDQGISKIQVYQVDAGGLTPVGTPIISNLGELSPDGTKLWVKLNNYRVEQIQIYQIGAEELILTGEPIYGIDASWASDGTKLWIMFRDCDEFCNKIQIYQVDIRGLLTPIGRSIKSLNAGWSPDGAKLWVSCPSNRLIKIQIYRVTSEGPVMLGAAVPGSRAGWSPDGKGLWTVFEEHSQAGRIKKIQIYQADAKELISLGEPFPGLNASWSPDGSKFSILNINYNETTVYHYTSLIYLIDQEHIERLSLAQQMFLTYLFYQKQIS